ncbi:MAG: DUF1156 domain-containing protein [Candidatus Hodarchaeales archaeon]
MTKRIIEMNLPIIEISRASTHEKSVRHGHPSTLHLWWARRPLAASRATIFASLIDFPSSYSEKEKLHQLIKEISPWNTVKDGNNPLIIQCREILKNQWKSNPPKVLDPFSGGGSIPLEALRLGCETYASDLNPLAVLIGKATLEWPQAIANHNLAELIEHWAINIQKEAYSEIKRFYPNDQDGGIPIGYLWARTIPCSNPSCSTEIPLIKHFWLAKTKKRSIAYKPIIDLKSGTYTFMIQRDQEIDFNPSNGTILRAKAKCLICEQVINANTIRSLAQTGKMSQIMTIVIVRYPNKAKKSYRVATAKDAEIYAQSKDYLSKIIKSYDDFNSLLPEEDLPPIGSLGIGVQHYGMKKWKDLFNDRQKLALITFVDKIKESYPFIKHDLQKFSKLTEARKKTSEIVLGYLAIILGRLADKNANLVVYNAYGEKIEHVFGRTALSMAWDYVELNVFSGANGDWLRQTEWVKRFVKNHSWKAPSFAIVNQASATKISFPNDYFDAIFTDPPYYDNVPYSDLSDFFYVWFKKILDEIFINLFATPLTPKRNEIVANKGRQKNPMVFFEQNIFLAFKEMNRVLKSDGIAIIVYAHKSTSGWATMLNALIQAGFVITASWPIHTEMKTRLRAKSSAALASSIYLVCRKHPQEEVGYFNEIQDKIKASISERLQRFWNEGIRGGDFFISAIGPAMEILSKYRQIVRYSGKEVSFQDQLDFIRTITTNYIVNTLIQGENTFTADNISHFYLLFRWTFQDEKVEFGEVQKLTQACGIELNTLKKVGIILQEGSKIIVLNALERHKIDLADINFVNIMHRLVIAWKEGKYNDLNTILSVTGHLSKQNFWYFCQAVAECHRITNPEKQLLEGLLSSKYSKV